MVKIMEDFTREKKRINFKVSPLLIGIVSVMLVVIVFAIVVFQYSNRCFTGYNVLNKIKRNDSNTAEYLNYNGNLLKYSRDGASAIDSSGNVLWNGGYEMERPQVDICGDYVAIADIGGKDFYVYNGSDSGTKMEMPLPIVKIRVAAQGVVAVLMQEEESNVINIYNPYSSANPLLVEVPTNISDDGYPMDFDISDDGNSLVTSFLTVTNGTIDNKASFYNFTDVGQDKNRLVGGKKYGENMIFHVSFLSNDKVAIFTQDGFSVFKDMKRPEEICAKTFDKEIKSIAYDDESIAVIENSNEDKLPLHIFDTSGHETVQTEIDYKYDSLELYEGELIFSSNQSCNIVRVNGREKFDFTYDRTIRFFLPTSKNGRYFLIDDNKIEQIKLSGS